MPCISGKAKHNLNEKKECSQDCKCCIKTTYSCQQICCKNDLLSNKPKKIDGDFSVCGDTVLSGNVIIDGQLVTQDIGPVNGFVAFWWVLPIGLGGKVSWGRVDTERGTLIGPPVPYSPSESRSTGRPGKVQFSRGVGPNDMVYMIRAYPTDIHYMIRHNTELGTYQKTDIGNDPPNHGPPQIITYDEVNSRYIAMAGIISMPPHNGKHVVVIIDPDTGVITPLTGTAGPYQYISNAALDMEVIGNRIFYFDQYYENEPGHIIFYDRDSGTYLGESVFQGNLIPYPGTFTQTWYNDTENKIWFVGVGYDKTQFRLHLALGGIGGTWNRNFAWIEADSEEDMIQKLESGNYDIYLTQHQPYETINSAAWILKN